MPDAVMESPTGADLRHAVERADPKALAFTVIQGITEGVAVALGQSRFRAEATQAVSVITMRFFAVCDGNRLADGIETISDALEWLLRNGAIPKNQRALDGAKAEANTLASLACAALVVERVATGRCDLDTRARALETFELLSSAAGMMEPRATKSDAEMHVRRIALLRMAQSVL